MRWSEHYAVLWGRLDYLRSRGEDLRRTVSWREARAEMAELQRRHQQWMTDGMLSR